jgi:hypothetical protein
LFGLPSGSNELQYDPSSSVDVQIILGKDWSSKVNGQ